MAFKPMNIIVPTIVETQLTGFIGGAERTLYGHTWRVEWHSGKPASLFKDGKAMAVKDIGKRDLLAVRSLILDSHKFFTRASEMANG